MQGDEVFKFNLQATLTTEYSESGCDLNACVIFIKYALHATLCLTPLRSSMIIDLPAPWAAW